MKDHRRRPKRARKLLFVIGGLLALLVPIPLLALLLTAPVPRTIGAAPADLGAVEIEFDGVAGWFVAAQTNAPCVVLMHGVRADRRSMIERARLLRRAGYASLLFDFQAHGASPGKRITFGHRESRNARSAVALLRSRFGCTQVAAIGQSLGGAAALLGSEPLQVDALILESVYPTIEEAVGNRLEIRLGKVGAQFTPLLLLPLQPLLGVDANALQPIRGIPAYRGPVLVIAGTADRHTTRAETLRLYAAAHEPKQLWLVEGAAHVDLLRFAPDAYGAQVLGFLGTHLSRGPDGSRVPLP